MPIAASESLIHVNPCRTGASAAQHVSAELAGETLWYECDRHALTASPEAFGSALLLPMQNNRLPIAIDRDVCSTWADNIGRIGAQAQQWWNLPPLDRRLQTTDVGPPAVDGVGLCFSCGVDSFYSLLRGPVKPSLLIGVIGFDIALDDAPRAESVRRSIERIANALGIDWTMLRTNFRSLKLVKTTSWEWVHGGALASCGHVLNGVIGKLMISSSFPTDYDHPWGSHWKVDPYHSSRRLEVLHVGAERWRKQKIQALVDEPLFREHVRVCWENRTSDLNCGQCEKCVRTMLALACAGKLDQFPAFRGGSAALAESIDRIARLSDIYHRSYQSFVPELPPDLARRVTRLLQRSRDSAWRKALRWGKGVVRRVLK